MYYILELIQTGELVLFILIMLQCSALDNAAIIQNIIVSLGGIFSFQDCFKSQLTRYIGNQYHYCGL